MLAAVQRDERIGNEIAAHARLLQQTEEEPEGLVRELDDPHVGQIRPPHHHLPHLFHWDRVLAYLRMGEDAG